MPDGFSLTLSHIGLFCTDVDRMVDFYTRVMRFVISDRGSRPDGNQIVFMTRDPREHHQFVLATGRPKDLGFNIINQLSFRVDSLGTLREMYKRMKQEPIEDLGPVTHGNAISLYFRDPEGNRIEVLTGTPWYIPQPYRIPVDLTQSDAEVWAYVEKNARATPGFMTVKDWEADISRKLAAAGL